MDRALKARINIYAQRIIGGGFDHFEKQEMHWSKSSDNHWRGETVFKKDFYKISEASVCKGWIAKDEKLLLDIYTNYPKLKDFIGMNGYFGLFNCFGMDEKYILIDLIHFILTSRESSNINESDIAEVVDQFENFCDTLKVNIRVCAIIEGFNYDENEIILTDSLKIRRLNEEEISEWQKNDKNAFVMSEFCIEITDIGKIINEFSAHGETGYDHWKLKFEDVIQKLNIYGEGTVRITYYMINKDSFCVRSTVYNQPILRQMHAWKPMSFSNNDANGFIDFFQNSFCGSIEKEKLDISINRLTEAKYRIKPQDAIIDGMIGLESLLFMNENNNNTTTEAFCMRFACMFPYSERLEKYKRAKNLYDVRSRIVHGRKLKKEDDLNQISEEIKIYLRDFLLKIIQNNGIDASNGIKTKDFWTHKYFEGGSHPDHEI